MLLEIKSLPDHIKVGLDYHITQSINKDKSKLPMALRIIDELIESLEQIFKNDPLEKWGIKVTKKLIKTRNELVEIIESYETNRKKRIETKKYLYHNILKPENTTKEEKEKAREKMRNITKIGKIEYEKKIVAETIIEFFNCIFPEIWEELYYKPKKNEIPIVQIGCRYGFGYKKKVSSTRIYTLRYQTDSFGPNNTNNP